MSSRRGGSGGGMQAPLPSGIAGELGGQGNNERLTGPTGALDAMGGTFLGLEGPPPHQLGSEPRSCPGSRGQGCSHLKTVAPGG